MSTSKCHYCYERDERGIWLGVFNRFCRFSKGAFWRKYPISTGRNDRLKPGKLLDPIARKLPGESEKNARRLKG